MVNPKIMCNKHLLGEHNEIHAFIGSLNKKIRLDNYFKNNLLEPLSIVKRHNSLVNEFTRRGFEHNTNISNFDFTLNHLGRDQINFKINKKEAIEQLLLRCADCLRLAQKFKNTIDILDPFFTLYSCPYCHQKIEELVTDEKVLDFKLGHINTIECKNCKNNIKFQPKIDYLIKF